MFSALRKTFLWVLFLPYLAVFIGTASNQAVLWANNDTFPVKVNLAKLADLTQGDTIELPDGTVMIDDVHCLMTSKTHLNLLADNWDFQNEGIESVGDMFIELGAWLGTFCPYIWTVYALYKRPAAV